MDDIYDQDEYGRVPSPQPLKAKLAAAKKNDAGPPVVQGPGGKAIEEIYQKKSQLEHILLRPDTYIGSTEKQQQQLWVHDGQRMVNQTVSFVPGLYKIFDEILVNASDNKATNTIQVWNNGNGIPVEMHKEEKVYVPELIFGHLLTSSNYDDNEKKVTGGRNGYGAKLANIFSTEFILETCDGQRLKRYKQVFRTNMTKKDEPRITTCKAGDNWTSVTFKPDLAKFGMEVLEEDSVALMRKRVYDMAGILGKTCKVYLNGERLGVKSFSEYVDLYLGPKEGGAARVYERVTDRWEMVVSPTDGQFQQVSFVNSICTIKGGTHVNYIVDQITKYAVASTECQGAASPESAAGYAQLWALVEKINKKNKQANVKPFMVKNHLWVFINCQIENPAFDSQTKENLTLRASSFGSKCELPALMIDRIAKSGVVASILQFATFKNNKELKKSDGAKRQRLLGIPKLDDANDAGGRNSAHCTLILTEGDSAKTLAISGLSVVGRDHYGVFPLRGKLLNVRDASAAQISGNAEIQNLKQILGLQHGKVYEDAKSLRYGHLMIMTDQDHDGSHIKGLIMNFLHTFYPSLLKLPGFLLEFITPIIKAVKGKQRLVFYTMPEYETWKDNLASTAGWSIKYYKGLGTSTREEAREYFAAIDQHRKEFVWEGDNDSSALEMAFSKKRVEERKEWLSNFVPGTYLDNSARTIGYTDFIHKELILFSRADLERSIPCMVDGLKPGQRKILFACFKRNLKSDIKASPRVVQLAGYVSEHAAYHHGEASLSATIVNLAQDYVGSNNINLLVPSGQFGTRLQGGKDAASARYIFTRLAPLTRHLFNDSDDRLLSYLNEEGQSIEPNWYIPVLPMVLVNGAEGIGTGWSTFIPNYNPRDIVANIKRLMAGQEQVGETTITVTELPVRKWTQDYKEFLETLVKPEGKDEAPLLAEYKEHHTDVTVHFILEVLPEKMPEMAATGVESKLKLSTKFSTGNMMLFDAQGLIKHYPSPEAIIAEFYDLRLQYYELRRKALLKAAELELLRVSNRMRFILAVINSTLRINNRKKAELEADLAEQGFDRLPNGAKAAKGQGRVVEPNGEEGDEEGAGAGADVSYNYLLSMPMWSLTWEKVQALQDAAAEQAAAVARLASSSPIAMWSDDLDSFLAAFEAWEEEEEAAASRLVRQQNGVRGGKGKKAAAGKAAKGAKKASKKKGSDDDSEADDTQSSDGSDEFVAAKPKPAAARKPAAPAAPRPQAPKSLVPPTQVAASVLPAAKPVFPKPAPPKPAAPEPVVAPAPAAPPVASLAARLAGRFQKLKVEQSAATSTSEITSTSSQQGLQDEADELADSMCSPAPPLLKTRPTAFTKALAAPPPAVSSGHEPAAAAKRKPAPAKPAVVAKGRKKQVVSDSEDSEEAAESGQSSDSDNGAVFELDAPSPAIAPKGKKSKVGPSPMTMKAASKLAAAAPRAPEPAAAKAAAAPKAKGPVSSAAPAPASVAAPSGSQDSSSQACEAARPQRARRTAAQTKVSYVIISDSDDAAGDADSGSDFTASGSDDE
ncbi:hypothetical protein QJQ45_007900 [Haematococcus lacustris]|nr:hypothetical protein QJQ45_007900 [Haematococcus lacustris]